MTLLVQTAVLFAICMAGLAISMVLPFPMPGSVTAMVLLLFLLAVKWLKAEHVEDVASFLLSNMAFFFVPVGVGLLHYADVLKSHFFALLFICLFSTVVTFAATAYTVQFVMWLQQKQKGGDTDA